MCSQLSFGWDAEEIQPPSVPCCSCWGAWGTVLVPGTQHFVDSTIKCYGILICSLLIFHFLNFWHSDAILSKTLPGDMNTFLELKVWLTKLFPRISSLTPIPFPREGLGLLWGPWLEMHTEILWFQQAPERGLAMGLAALWCAGLQLALLFLDCGLKFMSLLGIPGDARNRKN